MRNRYKVIGKSVIIFLDRKEGRPLRAYVDKTDLPLLKSLDVKWCAMRDYSVKKHEKFYVIAKQNGKSLLLHKVLIDCPEGYVIDHKDGNPFNNRRKNLRVMTKSLNALNRRGAELRSKSGVLGVHWSKKDKKWRARIKIGGKAVYEELFTDLEKARIAVNRERERLLNK